jgi:glycerophosphoryl diester phosphodiesterase
MRLRHFLLMFSIISFLFSCAVNKNKPVQIPATFDWQGHRGCRGLMPENSIPAFLKALEYPAVRTLELDLAVSRDGQLIVSHEPFFNPGICRKPGGDTLSRKEAEALPLYRLTAAEIRAYDCGSWGNTRFPQQQKQSVWKPTLREVVEAVRAKYPEKAATIRWNIEIKSMPEWDGVATPPIADFCQLVQTELTALGISANCTVQSFDVRPLQILYPQAHDFQLALLVENTSGLEANLTRLGFTPDVYSPFYMFVNKKMVRQCRQKGMKLVPWTVNDVPAMKQLLRLGVDGIITDYPDLIGSF